MTDGMMNQRALVEKSFDANLLRSLIGIAAELLGEPEEGAATVPAGARRRHGGRCSATPIGPKLEDVG
uniref:hypothetical protein n=1 Tax=Mesorhizobium sp. LHD-90 TaxID=3071414 RepID=UPI0035A90DBE